VPVFAWAIHGQLCKYKTRSESLENARFLKAKILTLIEKGEKNEEIMVSFVITGDSYGLQCVGLRG
jgi:hypothetical protein